MLISYEDDLVAETTYNDANGQKVELRITYGDLKAGFSPIDVCLGQGPAFIGVNSVHQQQQYMQGAGYTACVTSVDCDPMDPYDHKQHCVATTHCTTTTPITVRHGVDSCGTNVVSSACAGLDDLCLGGVQPCKLNDAQYKFLLEQWLLQEFDTYGYSNVRVYKAAVDAMIKIVSLFTNAVLQRLASKLNNQRLIPDDVELETLTGQILGVKPGLVSGTTDLPFRDTFHTTPLSRQMIAQVIRADFLQLIVFRQTNVVDPCDSSGTVQDILNIVTANAVNEAGKQFQQRVACRT